LDEYVETNTHTEMAKLEERQRKKNGPGKRGLIGKVLEKISNS
jgi:hypothetical protein